jgi:hypothetical protein
MFAEYLFGRYYGVEGENPNPYPERYRGVEAGLAFWQRWGALPEETGFFLPSTGWREVYWDAIYYQRDDDNFIHSFNGKEGFGALRLGPVAVDLYLRANATIDANKDYWNNYIEGGAGLRFRPISEDLDLRLSCELVGGYYLDRDGRYELPYDREYIGLRVEMTFWFGWEGREESEDEE